MTLAFTSNPQESNKMSYKAAIPTMSLGHGAAGHTLHDKLHAAKDAGFRGIEASRDRRELAVNKHVLIQFVR